MGAVSPAILAMARRVPVINPPFAEGITILKIVLHLCTPKAIEASRTLLETSFIDSSVVLATIGINMKESAMAPAKGEKVPINPITIIIYAVMPTIMDGNSVIMSFTVLNQDAYLLFPNSDKYTPDNTPIGTPIKLVNPIRIKDP